MRQITIAISLIGSFFLFASVVNLFDTLVMFLLFGILPGRSAPLSANHMLLIYASASAIVLLFALRSSVVALRFALIARQEQLKA